MGYQMVKWGAGVHQWQITLGELFEQLYVSCIMPNSPAVLTTATVGKHCSSHILPSKLRG